MSKIYEAVLRGDRLEWSGKSPEVERATPVRVILLDEEGASGGERGRRMSEALARVADMGGASGISEPGLWERENRRDRPLPGRDNH